MGDRIKVVNKQGQSRDVEPIDLPRWAKKGYFPEKQKPKSETVKDNK